MKQDIFARENLAAPYEMHSSMRDAGPLFYIEKYGLYGMARHADVMRALRDHATYCSGRGVGLSDFSVETPWRLPSLLLETDPPVHDRTRGLMNKVVSLPVIKALRPMWREKAEMLVDRLVRERTVDLIRGLAELFPMMIFPDMIGLPIEGRHLLLDYAAATFNAFGPRNGLFLETEERARPAIAWVAKACQRENLAPDGWGASVYRAADQGLCNEEEAGRLVRSFLSAGVDTTVNGIGNMLAALTAHPDQWQRLHANPSLAKKCFEESLRWDSTVQTFFRTTTHAVEIGENILPADSKVLLFLAAANRDPRRWDKPDSFDITRTTSGHLAFGFGIHQCLGQMVARQEAEVILEALLARIAEIRPRGPQTRRLNNTLRALESLPVELVPF
ncbi:cytochrome P450 [Sphingobium sp. AP50]|uniref:cytochrome P450 n=1 Tax=Sphingobium sp. AP50 TaxID=1884369 RepID=UPI001C434EBD|nr:cytochrome P450 [Sphingobium sp. AP50]